MVQFSKESQSFLKSVGGDRKKILTPTPASADRMTPGDILIFRYYVAPTNKLPGTKGQRVILIVRCKRGDGVFPGKYGDKLVSCFKLEGDSEVVIDTIIENLYKKRRKSSYYGKIKKSLIKLLGIDSYRTYKLGQMKEIYKVALGK
jgi:hypothetical protein